MNLLPLFALLVVTTGRWYTAFASGDWQRTVVFMGKQVEFEQFVFLRGGKLRSYTKHYPQDAEFKVPIRHRINGNNTHFNAWKTGDDFLDWNGPEPDQGLYNGQTALGTPMVWTTNDRYYHANVSVNGYGYTELNTWGEHYWMVDVDMDCSKTEDGWFELKGFGPGPEDWEPDVDYHGSRDNHVAKCGSLNMYSWSYYGWFVRSFD